ncbi:MAG: TetR/AcrR family transcriptional regulator [Acidimicrobiales bacterium]
MARPKLTRDQKKARTREALVDAAAQVFAERGFHLASLEQVADRAGFTIGAVYSNFAGKEELFLVVLDRWGVEEAVALGQGLAAVRTAEAAVEAVDTWFRERWSDPTRLFAIAEFMLHSRTRPAALDALRERALRVHAGLELIIESSRSSIPIAPDVDSHQAARAVLAISYGIAMQRIIEPDAPVADLLSHLLRRLVFDDQASVKRAKPR